MFQRPKYFDYTHGKDDNKSTSLQSTIYYTSTYDQFHGQICCSIIDFDLSKMYQFLTFNWI